MARIIVLAVSLFVAGLGAVGLVSPGRLLAIARGFQSTTGLYVAAALRVVLGVALIGCAPASRAPTIVRVLGAVFVVAGLITPMVGVDRFGRILGWWSDRGPAFQRVWAGFAFGLGLVLAYLVTP